MHPASTGSHAPLARRLSRAHAPNPAPDGIASPRGLARALGRLRSCRHLNLSVGPREEKVKADIDRLFDSLGALQGSGGEGRLNFELFGALVTPPPDLPGAGPHGIDYRRKEIAKLQERARALGAAVRANPLAQRTLAGTLGPMQAWRFEPGAAREAGPGAGPVLAFSKTIGALPSARALACTHELPPPGPLRPRSLEATDGGQVDDGPLAQTLTNTLFARREVKPTRSSAALHATARGAHANSLEPVESSAMWQSEAARLVRPAHFADKWDSSEDARRRGATRAARAARNYDNESRVQGMVEERQATVELTHIARATSRGAQAMSMMQRTIGQY